VASAWVWCSPAAARAGDESLAGELGSAVSGVALPAGPAVPAIAPRAFWVFAVLMDLVLLVLLPYVGWVALVVILVLLAAAAVARVERLLAFMIVAPSLLALIPAKGEWGDLLFYALRVLLLVGLVVAGRRAGLSAGSLLGPVLRDRRTIVLLFLCVWLWIGTLWTPAPRYGQEKALGFTLVVPLLFSGAALLWPAYDRERALDRWLRVGLIAGAAMALIGLAASLGFNLEQAGNGVADSEPPSSRLQWLGTSPIWLARALSIWLILALWAATRRRLPVALAAAVGIVALTLMSLTGSRGPLLALMLSPLGLLLLPRGPNRAVRSRRRVVVTLAVLAACLLAILLLVSPEQRARVGTAFLRVPAGTVLATSSPGANGLGDVTGLVGSDPSSRLRGAFLTRAKEALTTGLPWGLGTGGFAVAFTGVDYRLYPHNMIAEVLLENGLPGLLLVFLFVMWVWWGARRLARRGQGSARWVWVLFLMALLNAQVSGDLPFNEGIWFWGGMLLAFEIAEAPRAGTGRT
jgi:hypothetical protein